VAALWLAVTASAVVVGENPFAAFVDGRQTSTVVSHFDPSTAVLAPWWQQDWCWQPALFLGIIPALLMWLFGRACRYVLAGT
jgi:hypothetical protein